MRSGTDRPSGSSRAVVERTPKLERRVLYGYILVHRFPFHSGRCLRIHAVTPARAAAPKMDRRPTATIDRGLRSLVANRFTQRSVFPRTTGTWRGSTPTGTARTRATGVGTCRSRQQGGSAYTPSRKRAGRRSTWCRWRMRIVPEVDVRSRAQAADANSLDDPGHLIAVTGRQPIQRGQGAR